MITMSLLCGKYSATLSSCSMHSWWTACTVRVLQECMNGLLEAYCEQLIRDQSMDQAAVGSYARLLCRSRRRPLLVRFWLQLAAGFGLQECQAIWDCAVDDFSAWHCGDVEHAPGEEGWCLEVEEISMQVGLHRHWARAGTWEGGSVPACGKDCRAGVARDRPWDPHPDCYTARAGGMATVCQAACLWLLRPALPGRCSRCKLADACLAQDACPQQDIPSNQADHRRASRRSLLRRCKWLPCGDHSTTSGLQFISKKRLGQLLAMPRLSLSRCRWLMSLPRAWRAAPLRACRPPGGCPSRSSPPPWSAQCSTSTA